MIIFWAKAIAALVAFLATVVSVLTNLPKALEAVKQLRGDGKSVDWSKVMRSKKVLVVTGLFAASLALGVLAYSDDDNPIKGGIRVVVPPFGNSSGTTFPTEKSITNPDGVKKTFEIDKFAWDAADTLRGILIDAGYENGFEVVGQSDMQDALNQIFLSRTPVFDESTQIELGKMLGANMMVMGNVSQVQVREHPRIGNTTYLTKKADVTIQITVKDPETLKLRFSRRYTASETDLQEDAKLFLNDNDLALKALMKALQKAKKDKDLPARLTKKEPKE